MFITGGVKELQLGELTLGKLIRLFEGGAWEGAGKLLVPGSEFVGDRLILRSLFWSSALALAYILSDTISLITIHYLFTGRAEPGNGTHILHLVTVSHGAPHDDRYWATEAEVEELEVYDNGKAVLLSLYMQRKETLGCTVLARLSPQLSCTATQGNRAMLAVSNI